MKGIHIIMITIDAAATGRNMVALRNAAGLTTMDIANAMGFTSRNAIYRWFSGDSLPALDNIVVLADLFGVRVDDILVTRNV